jgi:hypothetical protein
MTVDRVLVCAPDNTGLVEFLEHIGLELNLELAEMFFCDLFMALEPP